MRVPRNSLSPPRLYHPANLLLQVLCSVIPESHVAPPKHKMHPCQYGLFFASFRSQFSPIILSVLELYRPFLNSKFRIQMFYNCINSFLFYLSCKTFYATLFASLFLYMTQIDDY